MGQVRDLIGAQGAAAAGVLGPAEHPGLEEGAIDDQLTAALEQIEQAYLALGSVELVLLLHRHPRHPSTLGGQRVTGAGQGLLLHEELLARNLPLLRRHDRRCFHSAFPVLHFLLACCHIIISFVFLSPIKMFLKRWQTAPARKRRIGAQAPWIPQRASPPRWTGTWDPGKSPLRLFPSRRRCLRLRTQSRLSVC